MLQEFGKPDDPRPLVLWSVPEEIRNRDLEEDEIADGLHWPPDDHRDYGDPFDGVPEGHGTQCAILAGGLKSGVAREAGLYLIKAGGAVLGKDEEVVEEDVCADSLVCALNHILDLLRDGGLPSGRTVLIIDTREYCPQPLYLTQAHTILHRSTLTLPLTPVWNIKDMRKNSVRGEKGYMEWHHKVEKALDDLDTLGGVLVTVAAGNDGREMPPGHADEYMPNILSARHGSPLIITGAVNNYGQLARLSSPGSLEVPITCYAVYVSILQDNSGPATFPGTI